MNRIANVSLAVGLLLSASAFEARGGLYGPNPAGGNVSDPNTNTFLRNTAKVGALPAERSLFPRALERRTGISIPDPSSYKRAATAGRPSAAAGSLECGVSGMCASFGSPQPDVSAWMGFPFTVDGSTYFVATHGQPATDLGGGNYATPLWNKQHLWINVNGGPLPLGLQPRYVMTDSTKGVDVFVVDYIGYARPGVNYSAYPFGQSISSLVLTVNSLTGNVVSSYIELHNEHDEFVGDVDLKIGDKLQSYLLGFERNDPTAVYLFWMADATTVTQAPVFFRAELYPGLDIPCPGCDATATASSGSKASVSSTQFFYIFESYGKSRSKFTDPLRIIAYVATQATQTAFEFLYRPENRYFLTIEPAEAAAIDAGSAGTGWSRTGFTFKTYSAATTAPAPAGAVPVCRFYGSVTPGPNSHFFTASTAECQALRDLQATTPITQPRWNYEGTAFRITETNAAQACAAGLNPVLRAYNGGATRGLSSNHRYTTSQAELQRMVAQGWTAEGVAFCAPP